MALSRCPRITRTRIRRWSWWMMGVLGVMWMTSVLLLQVTYYGDHSAFRFADGYIAFFWGGDRELRNSQVFNNFAWPYFATGAGMSWDFDHWGRWETIGPDYLLWTIVLKDILDYPRNKLGLFWLGCSTQNGFSYLGLPFWPFFLLGITGLIATSRRFHPPHGVCRRCRYDLSGLPPGSPCPECGKTKPS